MNAKYATIFVIPKRKSKIILYITIFKGRNKLNLKPAVAPAYLKMGFFGNTGSGKTYTSAKVLSQFIAEYVKESQLAMFDTEPSAGFIGPMVKKITGKELLSVTSRSFSDLMDFTDECIKNKYVALVDSITHPWRQLCTDYLEAKKSRVKGAGGNVGTTKLSLKDWWPLKEIWGTFSEKFVMSPIHFCICGREGDVWETVTDDEGKEEVKKTGVKMKTESEFGHEPSLLVNMYQEFNKHLAYVTKDRFDYLTCKTSEDKPDIEFFRPHIDALNIGGKGIEKSEGKKVFDAGSGPNWETIKQRRTAILENIKDDITLLFPGRTDEMQKRKIELLREIFFTSSWSEIENDDNKFSVEILNQGREIIQQKAKEKK
jgi:hypothetical protein